MPAPKGNKYAIDNKGGRPPVFKNVSQLSKKINEYFIYIEGEFKEENGKKITIREPEFATITGLSLFLGFSDRQSLYDYEKHEEFSGTIKKARTIVEHEYEKRLSSDKPTGPIFALKNMGWKDTQQMEHSGPNGKPIPVKYDLSKLSDEELRAIAEMQSKAGISPATPA